MVLFNSDSYASAMSLAWSEVDPPPPPPPLLPPPLEKDAPILDMPLAIPLYALAIAFACAVKLDTFIPLKFPLLV